MRHCCMHSLNLTPLITDQILLRKSMPPTNPSEPPRVDLLTFAPLDTGLRPRTKLLVPNYPFYLITANIQHSAQKKPTPIQANAAN